MKQSELDAILAKNPNISVRGEPVKPVRHINPVPLAEPGDRLSEPDDAYSGEEPDLQSEAERFLKERGYCPRTPKYAQNSDNCLWYVHINKAEKNPILLDLVLMDSRSGKYKEIELKVSGGKLSPEQRALCLRREGEVCWNIDQFMQVVKKWEQGKYNDQGLPPAANNQTGLDI